MYNVNFNNKNLSGINMLGFTYSFILPLSEIKEAAENNQCKAKIIQLALEVLLKVNHIGVSQACVSFVVGSYC